MALVRTTDYEVGKQFTDEEDYADGDRTGYEIALYNVVDGLPVPNNQVYYTVDHVETGRGLGSYATLKQVDAVIAEDREYLTATPAEEVPLSAGSQLALDREAAVTNTTQSDDAAPVQVQAPEAPVERTPSQQIRL